MMDYHVHSKLCRHGAGDIAEYVEAAIGKGVTEIGFSEHIPVPGLDDPTGRMIPADWDVYVDQVFAARDKYRGITIRFGIEADYLPLYMNYIEDFLLKYPFDFIIGSIHFVDDWDFSNPALKYRLMEFGVERLFIRYYEAAAKAASSGLYDIFGHFDLPKKLGFAAPAAARPFQEEALLSIQRNGMALDVNTSGLRKEAREIYPSSDLLVRAAQLSIPVILGSDAHHPTEVAADFDAAIAALRQVGYRSCVGFEKRKPFVVSL
ncbi:MAG: histidinol-phosphatase HisJ family protein [Calditrichaeota bacterium]|nr:MAG: histidinol-phosphatase HisJ family protein [Calditrichota bacterium]